jgi:hypothetical protein
VVHPEVRAMHNAMDRQTSFAHDTFANTSSMSLLSAVHTMQSAEFMENAKAHSSSLTDGASKTWSRATRQDGQSEMVLDMAVTSRPCVADSDLARVQVELDAPSSPQIISFSVQYDASLFDLVGFNYMDGMSHDDIQNVCQLFDVEELEPGTIAFVCGSLAGDDNVPAHLADALSVWVQAKAGASGDGAFYADVQ